MTKTRIIATDHGTSVRRTLAEHELEGGGAGRLCHVDRLAAGALEQFHAPLGVEDAAPLWIHRSVFVASATGSGAVRYRPSAIQPPGRSARTAAGRPSSRTASVRKKVGIQMLPRWLLYHPQVGEGSKFLYCVLHDLVAGRESPTRPVTRAELAESCGVSVDTIDRRLAQLVAAGAVESRRRSEPAARPPSSIRCGSRLRMGSAEPNPMGSPRSPKHPSKPAAAILRPRLVVCQAMTEV
jgi:hypothetical protein